MDVKTNSPGSGRLSSKCVKIDNFDSLRGVEGVYLYELNNYTLLLSELLQQAGIKTLGFVQDLHAGETLSSTAAPLIEFHQYSDLWDPVKRPLLYSDQLVINVHNPPYYLGIMGVTEYVDASAVIAPFKEGEEWAYIGEAIRRYGNSHDGVFYDIGANRGGATLIALNYYKHVVAIEANPAMQTFFNRSFKAHTNVQLVPCAVGRPEQSGQQTFFVDVSEHAGGSSLYQEYAERHLVDAIQEIEVTVKTLSDICEENGLPPTFIKVDVEGSEPDVLLGSFDLIKEHMPTILFECWCDSWERGTRELCERLIGAGYKIYCTVAGAAVWDVFEYGYSMDYVTNALCLPPGKSLPEPRWDNKRKSPLPPFTELEDA